MRKLPIGASDFKEIVSKGFLYIDKTKFIEEITGESYKNSDLTKKIKTYDECRYREKYIYKYARRVCGQGRVFGDLRSSSARLHKFL